MKKMDDLFDGIEVPRSQVSSSIHKGIERADKETIRDRKKMNSLVAAASIIFVVSGGTAYLVSNDESIDNDKSPTGSVIIQNADGSLDVPKMDIDIDGAASMLPFVKYDDEIYTVAPAKIDEARIGGQIDKKIGIAKDIDVKDDQEDSSERLPDSLSTNMGQVTISSLKGYPTSFRILAQENDGKAYVLDRLTNYHLESGDDLFKNLKLEDSVNSISYMTYSDWEKDDVKYKGIKLDRRFSTFIKALKQSKPVSLEGNEEILENNMNDEGFRLLRIDGGSGYVTDMKLLKPGYVMYGNVGYVFRLSEDEFRDLWNMMN